MSVEGEKNSRYKKMVCYIFKIFKAKTHLISGYKMGVNIVTNWLSMLLVELEVFEPIIF